ncbi:hypothetical protein Ple7327_1509 [Pleurocapsa sp. PCC 7327]|nr:hypothetical protein Ple7327_1509 [Pleurocapsa sp. PCC 7327]
MFAEDDERGECRKWVRSTSCLDREPALASKMLALPMINLPKWDAPSVEFPKGVDFDGNQTGLTASLCTTLSALASAASVSAASRSCSRRLGITASALVQSGICAPAGLEK